ncbi:DUF523 domain-containing protein [Thalassotalea sp. LPB0316]|uniref:DUF523 domain-containing protein n=1 Tax=Thalassotalea sp. LPB0316 TaxID=2769490 RepID=UPI00186752AE|nr:DUF523 domain-containing protein [Thalassotalea sp. LPB0316]QOL26288.1 DUF523 domain-containing protein [Thalassotalea sp. LPB0316]
MEKILISSCLLGQPVRYDGQSKPLAQNIIQTWQQQGRLVNICPEVAGGLSVPRAPAEYNPTSQKVKTCDGEDVTQAFIEGAHRALTLCLKHGIRYALLKESSPSCGSNLVYDGSFSQRKVAGMGITAKLLSDNGIQVFSEETLDQLISLIKRE